MSWLWIVAGPNGSGKSTFVRLRWLQAHFSEPLSARFEALNPDDIAASLRLERPDSGSDEIDLEAVRLSDDRLDQCIAEGRSVMVETVLSSDKHRRRVEEARVRGYKFGMIYVTVSKVELSVRRVEHRAKAGGHDVPEERIRDRWHRSHANLPWFASRADRLLIFDNGELFSPVLVYSRVGDEGGWLVKGRLPAVEAVLRD